MEGNGRAASSSRLRANAWTKMRSGTFLEDGAEGCTWKGWRRAVLETDAPAATLLLETQEASLDAHVRRFDDTSKLLVFGGVGARVLPSLHCRRDPQEQDETQKLQERRPEHLSPSEALRFYLHGLLLRRRLDFRRIVRSVDGALGLSKCTSELFRRSRVGLSGDVFLAWRDQELFQGHFASAGSAPQLLQLPEFVECNHGVGMVAPTQDATRIVGHFGHGLAHVLSTHGLLEGLILV
eukprot:scaffold426_cov319-Pavlova_lutheri.AAC.33